MKQTTLTTPILLTRISVPGVVNQLNPKENKNGRKR